jgi:magnesium chelatase accessory protein
VTPVLAVGHSAGAAIALRMRLDEATGSPLFAGGIVSLNGALSPFPGAAGQIFPVLAKLLFLNPLAVRLFAWRANQPGAIAKLMEQTGSHIDAAGLDFYRRLLRTTGHVEGALAMMSQWNLEPLRADLGRLTVPLTLVAAANDRAVPPGVAREAAAATPGATVVDVPELGHLAHEEAPARLEEIVRRAAGAPA